ncbi:histone h4 [Anaeramoeba flamelloides]|uniref:Histone h4 n=1 Tax=Anaeramoeba flamelloides TaxID=1746091 RepID=A0AAV8A6A6_9EUKA|nr:histone h4 [Anaeramoeba flamelloides]KAJ6243783.1 histone h4 [Anaeramoeba flamelloides]
MTQAQFCGNGQTRGVGSGSGAGGLRKQNLKIQFTKPGLRRLGRMGCNRKVVSYEPEETVLYRFLLQISHDSAEIVNKSSNPENITLHEIINKLKKEKGHLYKFEKY